MLLLVEGEYSNFFSSTCTRSFNSNVAGFVDNNLIDMRVANNIAKWLQNVATRYSKRPLQADGNWLLGRPRPNRLIILVLRRFIMYIK